MSASHAPVSPDLRADLLGIAREVLQEEAVLTAAHDITSTIRIQNSSTTDDTMSASRSSRKKASKSGGRSITILHGILDALDMRGCPELIESLFDRSAPWTLVIVTARDDIKNRCDRAIEWK